MKRTILLSWVVASAALFAACTNDYSTFDTSGGAGAENPDGSIPDGTAGTGGLDGSAGKDGSTGGKGGTGGTAAKGGAAGTGGTSTGGAAGKGGTSTGGAAGKGGTTTGGAGGSATGGSAGTGGCAGDEKDCGGCVKRNDPAYGCGNTGCTACALDHATATCNNGVCAIQGCDAGFDDCDSNPANGCEVGLANSTGSCGSCGRACANDNVNNLSCNNATCDSSCTQGWGNCAEPAAPAADDGCETALGSNVDNCGGCGHACSTNHVLQASCNNGLCDSTCNGGWGNCHQPAPGTADDGCESNLMTSQHHCSSCTNDCALLGGNGGFTCQTGSCGCGQNNHCTKGGGAQGACASGICSCDNTACRPGEWCRHSSNNNICTCFNDTACTATQVCCGATQQCETNCPP